MHIALLTLPLNVNIGGVLQAYALQNALETMGHKTVHIQPSFGLPSDKTLFKRFVKRGLRSLCGKENDDVFEIELLSFFANYHINQFRQKYLHEVSLVDWRLFVDAGYDAFIVGSDQIWRKSYSQQYFPNNFLSFSNNTNSIRISYAASFGTDKWEYDEQETSIIESCLRLFNAVSVREETGIRLCKEHLNLDAKCVLDPTMLLKREDYENIVRDNNTPASAGTLLIYLLDKTEDMQDVINDYALNHRLIPFSVNNPLADSWRLPAMERQQYSVYKWLRGFMDAKMIITDSFHACVFSILFNKPFIVIGNKNRGTARFDTLLSSFNLMNRLVDNANQLETVSLSVDYKEVNEILERKRTESLLFLKQALAREI